MRSLGGPYKNPNGFPSGYPEGRQNQMWGPRGGLGKGPTWTPMEPENGLQRGSISINKPAHCKLQQLWLKGGRGCGQSNNRTPEKY
jgi:hypothetical protein